MQKSGDAVTGAIGPIRILANFDYLDLSFDLCAGIFYDPRMGYRALVVDTL